MISNTSNILDANSCALVILASGKSKRFGHDNKLLYPLKGKSLIEYVVAASEPIMFHKKFAVISSEESTLQKIFTTSGFTIVENKKPEIGQGFSISLGVKAAINAGCKSVCILLGDMPLIPTCHLSELLNKSKSHDVVISCSNGVRHPPVIFSGIILQEIIRLNKDQGAHNLLSDDVYEIPLSEIESMDLDSPEDIIILEQFIH